MLLGLKHHKHMVTMVTKLTLKDACISYTTQGDGYVIPSVLGCINNTFPRVWYIVHFHGNHVLIAVST